MISSSLPARVRALAAAFGFDLVREPPAAASVAVDEAHAPARRAADAHRAAVTGPVR